MRCTVEILQNSIYNHIFLGIKKKLIKDKLVHLVFTCILRLVCDRIHHPYCDAEYEGTVHFCRVSCKLSESFELTYF
jgi:hypothetical protein